MKNEIIDTIKLVIIIFLSILIGIMISNKYSNCKINDNMYEEVMKNIRIDGVNEGYEGQVVLKLNNNYYEYIYKSNDSQYIGLFE